MTAFLKGRSGQGIRNAVAKLKQHLKGSVSQTRNWVLGAAGSLAAITLSWWWMIEDARQPKELPIAALGQQIEAGRIWLTPLRFYHDAGRLILDAELENPTGETQTGPFGIPASARAGRCAQGDDAYGENARLGPCFGLLQCESIARSSE